MKTVPDEYLGKTFEGFGPGDLPEEYSVTRGKVRDLLDLGDELLVITTDRVSAFDRVLATIPCKGQVLNMLSVYWFQETRDIIPNHLAEVISPRTVAVKKCAVLPVEVVVRGYLTGSAWRDYRAGKTVSGIPLPPGMRFNQRFPEPLLTPSTKAERGVHDEPISSQEILDKGLVSPAIWARVEEAARALFSRGTELAAQRGLILVDTKYEFGLLDGELILVDEVHTPDSSRYWFSDSYEELFEAGEKQRKLDKEYLRQWLMDRGFMGDGEIPFIPDEIRLEVARRYIEAYKILTGEEFSLDPASGRDEREAILQYLDQKK
ncbi:MAG: phosphoribosylaminoimidazolesuccinocarboxamide synthase [Spirochaetales bacterium]|nr:phosphoribosylaminoimidazolesuccinocarboxamide synthase [Spirochaetales bacterium]